MAQPTFQIITFNGENTLEATIEAIKPYGRVLVSEGPLDWYRRQLNVMSSTDRTYELLHDLLPAEDIISGVWETKRQMFNCWMERVPIGTTHLWEVDDDEVWDPWVVEQVIAWLDDLDSLSFRAISYYSLDRWISGFEHTFEVHRIKRWKPGSTWASHRPPTMQWPGGLLARDHNHMDSEATWEQGWHFHHYSFCFPNRMAAKVPWLNARTPGLTKASYFKDFYLEWLYTYYAGDDDSLVMLEQSNRGVHDWPPRNRGDTYTWPFPVEDHPITVQKRLREWSDRIWDQFCVHWSKEHTRLTLPERSERFLAHRDPEEAQRLAAGGKP